MKDYLSSHFLFHLFSIWNPLESPKRKTFRHSAMPIGEGGTEKQTASDILWVSKATVYEVVNTVTVQRLALYRRTLGDGCCGWRGAR